MATFDYTYAAWDKIRPVTLSKTGLGDVLKKYEKDKAHLSQAATDCTVKYIAASAALDDVEKARSKAVNACGKNPLYKSAKVFLEGGINEASERKTILVFFAHHILNYLGTYPKEVTSTLERKTNQLALCKKAHEIFKLGKRIPDNVMTVIKDAGSAPGIRKFPGETEIREFYSRSAFKKLLPEIHAKCGEMQENLVKIQEVDKEITGLVGILSEVITE